MKILLQNRMWVALILSCSLALLFVSNCTPERGSEGTSSSASSGTSDGGSTTGSTLSCDQIEKCSGSKCECSGSDCCKEDEDCKDTCENTLSNDGLDLNGDAEDTCLHMEEDVVKKLFEIIDDLDKAKVDDLRDIGQDKEAMELLCSAVKKLDYNLLDDRIDDYTSASKARKALGWIAESTYATAIFENAEDKKGVPMFQKLLQKASGDSGDDGILNGLGEDVTVEDNDEEQRYVMRWALESSNHELVRWIHNEIIVGNKKGLCGKESNRPNAPNNNEDHKDDYGEPACILGVYCKIAADDISEDNDFRKEMAELIDSEVEVSDFIKQPIADGGLGGLADEDDADEWVSEACNKLETTWSGGNLSLF